MTRRDAGRTGLRSGFTLIELLVAMGIFAALGTMILTLLRGSLDLFSKNERRGEALGKVELALELLESDLSCVWSGDPAAGAVSRFECDWARRASGEKPVPRGDPRSFRLRLVRTIPGGEMHDPILRFAGTRPGSNRLYTGADVPASAAPDVAPPGGLIEVAWILDRGPTDGPGELTLYRAVRAPVLRAGSFFDPATEDAMDRPDWAENNAEPVVSGVLFFALLFAGDAAVSGEEAAVFDPRPDGGRPAGGPDLWWDSTRERRAEFSRHRPGVAGVPEDDVFPRRVRVVLTVASDGERIAGPKVEAAVLYNGRRIEMSTTAPIARMPSDDRAVKIGDEWMNVTAVDRGGIAVRRGARRTAPAAIPAGTPVLIGSTYRRLVTLACGREFAEAGS